MERGRRHEISMNEPNKREEEEFSAEFYEDVKTGVLYCREHKIPATKVEMLEYIQKVRDAAIEYGKENEQWRHCGGCSCPTI